MVRCAKVEMTSELLRQISRTCMEQKCRVEWNLVDGRVVEELSGTEDIIGVVSVVMCLPQPLARRRPRPRKSFGVLHAQSSLILSVASQTE